MLKDIAVIGSSHASGVGSGGVDRNGIGQLKSWVNCIADSVNAENVWNYSMPGKPVGMTNLDTVQFCNEYYKKYRSYDNLFCFLEYTLPQYKTWDPISFNTQSDIQAVPFAYYKMGKDGLNEHLTDAVKVTKMSDFVVQQKFFVRNTIELSSYNSTDRRPVYEEVAATELDETYLESHIDQVKEWFQFDMLNDDMALASVIATQKYQRYYEYAGAAIKYMQEYLEDRNIPYMMFWAGGQSKKFCKKNDRIFSRIVPSNRLIPMTEFTVIKAAHEWSIKHWRSHPDEEGHRRIAEFLLDYGLRHKLFHRPDMGVYTGYEGDF